MSLTSAAVRKGVGYAEGQVTTSAGWLRATIRLSHAGKIRDARLGQVNESRRPVRAGA